MYFVDIKTIHSINYACATRHMRQPQGGRDNWGLHTFDLHFLTPADNRAVCCGSLVSQTVVLGQDGKVHLTWEAS